MISIPDFYVGGVARWEIVLRKPSDGVTPVAPNSDPTVVVVKNGTSNADSVTVTATGNTGGFKFSYDPAGDAEQDHFAFRVSAPITDTAFNGGAAYTHVETFECRAKAVERGTDGAGSGDATLAMQTAIKVATDRFLTMIVVDGAVYQYTANALELEPSGSSSITVIPLTGVVESRVDGTTITVFTAETPTISIAVVDAEGDAVNVSAMTLKIVIETLTKTDVAIILDAAITKVTSTISFAVPSAASATEGSYRWSLRKTTDGTVLLQGPWVVAYAAGVDP